MHTGPGHPLRAMTARLDQSDDEPLFEQIANTIRWRISVAELKAGDPLPPTRSAAEEWGANRHTVAHAYRLLVEAGLLRRGARGAVEVAPAGVRERASEEVVAKMVEDIAREARKRGVALDRLTSGLLNQPSQRAVTAVECTPDQCEDLRLEIERTWDVAVTEYCMTEQGEPPPGPYVSTLAHYEEVRKRWPKRRRDEHFVAAATSPSLGPVLSHLCGRSKLGRVVVVVADDLVGGSELCRELADMTGIATNRFEAILAADSSDAVLRAQRGEVVIAATPHANAGFSAEVRSSAFVVRIHYRADTAALEGLAAKMNWRRTLPAPLDTTRNPQ